jgi:hypothetical protein
MAAIITEQFRKNLTNMVLSDIDDNNYYITIGQQDPWQEIEGGVNVAPYPSGSLGDQKRILEHITGMFKVSNNVSKVVPRYNIDSTKQYKVYDPYDAGCFYPSENIEACFVCSNPTNSLGVHIFLCVSKTLTASTATISGGNAGLGTAGFNSYGIYEFDDGYTWVYLGKILENNPINTNSFVGIDDALDAITTNIDSTEGLLYGFHILNGGNVYVNTPSGDATLTLSGFTSSAGNRQGYIFDVKVKVENNALTQITFPQGTFSPDPEDQAVFDFNFKNWLKGAAILNLTVLSELPENPVYASVIAKIAPADGFGVDKTQTLPSWYIGVYCDTVDATYIPDGTSYHQISLVKNPLDETNALCNSNYVQPLKYFTRETQSVPLNLGPGWRMEQEDLAVGVLSHIQTVDANNDGSPVPLAAYRYYYYQDHRYGYGYVPNPDSPLTFFPPSGVDLSPIIITDIDLPGDNFEGEGYKADTGTVMFTDNRGTVIRAEGQNEELKVIIQL